jgi:putative ABC transport system permease protein
MLQKLFNSFGLAFANIRSNLFHTVLSVLGIVIGVAALVSILSLIDGMEQFARDQIGKTTSLNSIMVRTETHKTVNQVRVKRDSVAVITYENFVSLSSSLAKPARGYMRSASSGEVNLASRGIGAHILATAATLEPGVTISNGALFTTTDVENEEQYAVVNNAFVNASGVGDGQTLLDQEIVWRGKTFVIKGTLAEDKVFTPKIYFPITVLSAEALQASPADIFFEAGKTEEVPALKEEITQWLNQNFQQAEDSFTVLTNDFRIEQATRGFLLFRVIMGLIVGISVVVGGIGVMNVLLISVTERTAEIGIRKATGANRQDIVLLFLSESVTISAFGSFLGLILGVLGTMVIIPIVKAITEAPFQAAYTWNTFSVIAILSLLVGIAFGTYPAIRASRLNPVDAIRHE